MRLKVLKPLNHDAAIVWAELKNNLLKVGIALNSI